jgi:hypothetical protein
MSRTPPVRVAERQTRRYTALGNGHTSVHVEWLGARFDASAVLADIEPPFLGISGGLALIGPSGETLPLQRCRIGEGYRYVLEGEPRVSASDRWELSYSVAPGLHANHRDTTFSTCDELGPVSVCDHVLRVPCEVLEIEVTLACNITKVEPVAHGPSGRLEKDAWTARCRISDHRKSARLVVEHPALGHRYGVRYWFDKGAVKPAIEASQTCQSIVRAVLPESALSERTIVSLRTQLGSAINYALTQGSVQSSGASVLGENASWRVLLWDATGLVTCFTEHTGEGGTRHWPGKRVAAQCLRTWQPMGYVKSASDRRVFADGDQALADWTFCVPLTAGAGQAPIGVLVFAGDSASDPVTGRMERLAREFDVFLGDPRGLHDFAHHLSWIVNANFWAAVAKLEALGVSRRLLANSLAESFENLGAGELPIARSHDGERLSERATAQTPAPPSRRHPSSKAGVTAERVERVAESSTWAWIAGTAAVLVAVIVTITSVLTRNDSEMILPPTASSAATPIADRRLEDLHAVLAAPRAARHRPDLARRDLSRLNLDGFDFRSADLRHTRFSQSSLVASDLGFSDLRGADLSQADLRSARLEGACFDDKTRFPPDFSTVRFGMVRAVRIDVTQTSGLPIPTVDVEWAPSNEWMIVRWYEASDVCRSGSDCGLGALEVQQSPVSLALPPGRAQIELFRKGAPYAEASLSIDIR